jgi:hypothetical protein
LAIYFCVDKWLNIIDQVRGEAVYGFLGFISLDLPLSRITTGIHEFLERFRVGEQKAVLDH